MNVKHALLLQFKNLIRIFAFCGLTFLFLGMNCFADYDQYNQYVALPDVLPDSELPDLFTGAMTYTVPIKMPPGRNGMAPDIALSYRSNNGNGWLGMGWELGMEAIQRSTRWGVDYTKEDNLHLYQLHKTGSTSDLVLSTDNYYHTKIEGNFARIRKQTATDNQIYWEVTDKSGKRFLYGQSAASRQDDPADATRIYKWCLDQVVDTNGNYMTLTYFKDQGQIYLDRIDYTGNGGVAPTNYVKFYRENRNDAPNKMYTTNFMVETQYRLKTIDIVANGTRVRAYNLAYLYSAGTDRSLLQSIIEYGDDAAVSATGDTAGDITNAASAHQLPAISLTYSAGANGFNSPLPMAPNEMSAFYALSYNPEIDNDGNYVVVNQYFQFPGDFNGDGKNDFMYWGPNGWTALLNNGNGFNPSSTWAPHNNTSYGDTYWGGLLGPSSQSFQFTGDFNGDGKTDYMYWGPNGWNVLLSNGNGFDPPQNWAPYSDPSYGATYWPDYTAVSSQSFHYTGDFNGDGKTDFMYWNANGWHVLLSNGNGFDPPQVWAPKDDPNYGATYWPSYLSTNRQSFQFTGDFNGDGKTDFMYWNANGWNVLLSNGNGFDPPQVWAPSSDPSYGNTYFESTSIQPFQFTGDFNGDGKTDFMYWGPKGWTVLLSNGNGFDPPQVWAPKDDPNYGATYWPNYTTVSSQSFHFTGDFNGDGKTDFMYWGPKGWTVLLSNGNGFDPPQSWSPSNVDAYYPSFDYFDVGSAPTRQLFQLAGDFTGDGKSDFMYWGPHGWTIISANGEAPDLLASISNGTGGSTAIGYIPSTTYSNTQLPFPIWTVSSITTDDGNGNVGQTNFTFSGGFYHIGERDFRGFNYAKVTGPAGPNLEQKVKQIWFHQGNDTAVISESSTSADLETLANVATGYTKGKPYRTRISGITNGATLTYSDVETVYTDLSTGGYNFTPAYQVDTYTCAGGVSGSCKGSADARQSETVYASYDAYGNVLTAAQFGDISDPTDDRIVTRSFAYNPAAWIVGLPASETVNKGSYPSTSPDTTKTFASTTYYYDGVSDCSAAATSQAPTLGNLSRIVRLNSGGSNPETWAGYDLYGNPVCTRDANGNISRVSYDGSYTFPQVSTNSLGQQTITQYYGVNGVAADNGQFGEVKSLTDPNNAVTSFLYDPLGRKIRSTRADSSWIGWSYNNFGTINTQNIVASQNIRVDSSAGPWSIGYFDGLGRIFKNRSSGPDAKTSVTDTLYDKRGAVTKSSLPYFEGIETARYVANTYDPMGRVTQTTNPDPNERVLACYDEGVTVTIDPNNHRKRGSIDVLGRLRKVEEYKGTFTSCDAGTGTPYATTTYQYDPMGNLTNVTDTKNNQTVIHYDTLGRKTDMTDPDMGFWQYQYDLNGNLTLQTDANLQKIKFGYDALNRLLTKDYGADNTPEITYTYDEAASTYPLGQLTTMNDQSGTTKYFYDQLGRASKTVQTVDGVSYTIGTSYDDLDRIKNLTYPNKVDNETVAYNYDTGGNLSTVTGNIYDNNGTFLNSTVYAAYTGYNALGQPGSVTLGNGVKTNYVYYPSDNQLQTLATASPSAVPLVNLSYSYDYNGNILSIADYVNTIVPHNVSGASYSLFPGKAHAFGITGKNFQYDANGNMASDGTRTITYNYDNMPQSINGTAVSFVYDGTGKRVKKVTPTYTITYIDKLYECPTSQPCGMYIFAGDTRIALKNSNDTFYYHPNHLGSTMVVTNASGAQVDTVNYHPFGETSESPVPPNTGFNHEYTGQEMDAETGLYNYNARLYNPETGRFISADSIVPDPSDPQSLNRYSYVQNNPVNFIDPTGHGDSDGEDDNTSIDFSITSYDTSGGFWGEISSWISGIFNFSGSGNANMGSVSSLSGGGGGNVGNDNTPLTDGASSSGSPTTGGRSGGNNDGEITAPSSPRSRFNDYVNTWYYDFFHNTSGTRLNAAMFLVGMVAGPDTELAEGGEVIAAVAAKQSHHWLARLGGKGTAYFKAAGLNNESSIFKESLSVDLHQVLHGKGGIIPFDNTVHKWWQAFIRNNQDPVAARDYILPELEKMKTYYEKILKGRY